MQERMVAFGTEQKDKDSILVYHGSCATKGIGDVKFPGPRNNCDFGAGFYVAERKETAEEWIVRESTPVVSTYRFSKEQHTILHLTGREWIRVVVGFRTEKYRVEFKSSVICGAIADDRMIPSLAFFMEGAIGDLRLLKCLDYCKLGNQFLFRNSMDGVEFIKSTPLGGLELQKANDRCYVRRKNMEEGLRKIYKEVISGELFVDDYLQEGDYVEERV